MRLQREILRKEERATISAGGTQGKEWVGRARTREKKKRCEFTLWHKKRCSCSERLIKKRSGGHSGRTQKRGGVEAREPKDRRRGGGFTLGAHKKMQTLVWC